MAEREFYNLNDQISYPLVHEDPIDLLPLGVLPKKGLVDAGFTMGKDSEFDPGSDAVYLYGFTVASGDVSFDFRSGAPGFALYRFLFAIPAGTPFGATCYEDATLIAGGSPDVDRGSGFITIGDLADIQALGDGTYTVDGILRVEPALIQSENNLYVYDVSLANKARCCPLPCGSSSSSSSGAPECNPDSFYTLVTGLVGDMLFKEGNNVTIQLDVENNALNFDARVGYGMYEACEDVIIDGDGEAGFKRGEFCLPCNAVISSLNGREFPNGKLLIVGWPGVTVVPDQANYEVGIVLDTEKLCEG